METVFKSPAQMYINGAWVPALNGKTFQVQNPATLETIAEVADGGKEEVSMAIEAADAAFPG